MDWKFAQSREHVEYSSISEKSNSEISAVQNTVNSRAGQEILASGCGAVIRGGRLRDYDTGIKKRYAWLTEAFLVFCGYFSAELATTLATEE